MAKVVALKLNTDEEIVGLKVFKFRNLFSKDVTLFRPIQFTHMLGEDAEPFTMYSVFNKLARKQTVTIRRDKIISEYDPNEVFTNLYLVLAQHYYQELQQQLSDLFERMADGLNTQAKAEKDMKASEGETDKKMTPDIAMHVLNTWDHTGFKPN